MSGAGGEILFLAHRLPFPPDRGDRIRSHHILKALARLAPVHVGCLDDGPGDPAGMAALAQVAASHCLVPRSKPLVLAGVEAMLAGQPVSVTAFHSATLQRWVAQVLTQRDIAAIYVFSGQMGHYVPADWQGRLVVDLVDVDSAKFEAYAQAGERPWLNRREGRLLARMESDLANRADATLLVSEAEADLLRSRVSGTPQIRALGNGIDCARFDPAAVSPAPAMAGGGPQIVFTGQMDYAPNVAAVTRMARAIMPEARRFLPQARFHIVGRAPTPAVRALDGVDGTEVVGEVPDTRPWLAGAAMVVAPLTIARGVQNKVLEAMAMARPVIVSPDAATGIAGRSQQHFIVAESDAAFVAAILRLATEPQVAAALGTEARRLVQGEMSWPAMLADLPKLLGFSGKGVRDAA